MRRRRWLAGAMGASAAWLSGGASLGCATGARAGAGTVGTSASAGEAPSALLARYRERAERLRAGLGPSPATRRFLDEAWRLPARPDRTVIVDGQSRTIDEETYYVGRGGEPLAYTRLLALAEAAGASFRPGSRWLDFGYGAPGQLQMLGRMGLDVVGVDVDRVAAAAYSDPSDIEVAPGRLTLALGRWPVETGVREQVGSGFDCFISKNTLKRGYIRPARETDPSRLIDLGVSPLAFLEHARSILREGALFVIWNLCPAQSLPPAPYIPWADGESPFTEAEWASAGFELAAFDVDDRPQARALARALDYDQPDEEGRAWDIETELSSHYTIAVAR
jgi:hypothetical protein